jgi:glycosyltransferase involved in cell wall biosynthesis|tara:strand:- start:221 stop:880 length:660 start_codon:yes stop_codon:yes gene_type:complete
MKEVPDITVGICCFKQKKWLHRCLRSLSSQTLSLDKFEVIVVNDDPETDISDICNAMSETLNLKLVNNQKNLGLPASLNHILSIAKGRLFVRVDSDDYVSKHFLYMLGCFLNANEDYQAVYCDYLKVDDIGRKIGKFSAESNPIACGVMFTYESLCELGFYNESFKMREGHDLFQRFNERFTSFHLPISLYRYRMHGENRTNNTQEVSKYDKILGEKNG